MQTRTKINPWINRYVFIYRGITARHIRGMEVSIREYAECKAVGYRQYKITDRTTKTTCFMVIASYRECERFAHQCYDAMKENEWKPISIQS
ncbi:hypothetical protein BAC3_01353 [uncultured bacterium]|nr:hypothetical protein BAC3_01353 [uncultured bacterium]